MSFYYLTFIWVNSNVHAVLKKNVWPSLCAFSWVSSTLMYVTDAPVSTITDFLHYILCGGGWQCWEISITLVVLNYPNPYDPATHPLFLVISPMVSAIVYFFRVAIIPLGAFYAVVSLQNFISTHPEISCLIQLLFIVVYFSCLYSLFLPMSTVWFQVHICCHQGIDSIH